jgi:tetratricopeptide (TPR) repeat protein
MLAASPPRVFDLRLCARVARERSDMAAERERVDACLAREPRDAVTLYLRAALNRTEGKQAESLADYKALAEAHPEAAAWNNLAWAEVVTGDFASAREHADRAVAENPDSGFEYGTRCFALAGLGQVEAARADCTRAVQLMPDSAIDRGMLAFLDRRYSEARRLWQEASRNPASARDLEPWMKKIPAR